MLASLALSAAVLNIGVARWQARTNPALAARIAPYDARLSAKAAQTAIEQGAAVNNPGVERLAATALRRDATIPAAIEIRALEAAAAGDHEREALLFALSDAISRRSLGTRLWRIQQSVNRGDVSGALEEFDIALRTSSEAPKVLFPVLAQATLDPTLAEPLAKILDRPEDWRVMFLHYAIADAHVGRGVSDVVLKMRDRQAITDAELDQTLIGELVSQGEFVRAREVHEAFHSAHSGDLVADSDFSHPAMGYPFGWTLVQKGELRAERSTVDGRPALAYQSLPGASGQVASQLLTLPPGDYRLTVGTASADSDGGSLPYWTLTCGDGANGQIALLDQPAAAGATAGANFTVPAVCTGQWLALHLRPSDLANRSGAIAPVSITRR